MTDRDHPNIVNESDVEWSDGEPIVRADERNLGYKRKRLAAGTGSEKLGCSMYELQPGQRPFVPHYHLSNEEAIHSTGRGRFSWPTTRSKSLKGSTSRSRAATNTFGK